MPSLDTSAATPEEIWGDFFSKRRPSRQEVAKLLLELHAARKHEHVIAAIEAAIINGQSQTWMYDVLALSMKIAGRPQADVERVLLSRVDFTGTDVSSMLISAAYLTRFGAEKEALALYRQASQIAPTRPEPYVMGLKIANRLKDYNAVRWAAAGILTTAWTSDRDRLHRDARNALLDGRRVLLEQNRKDEADAMQAALDEALKRDLIFKLEWSGQGDLDLLVGEPPGTVCSFEDPQTAGGGVLVHDGFGPQTANCYEEYVCAQGVPGIYVVRVRHAWGEIVGRRARLTIIRCQGSSHESVQTVTVTVGREDALVRVSLPNGRRTELRQIDEREVTQEPLEPRGRRDGMPRVEGPRGRGEAARDFAESRRRQAQARGGNFSAVGYQPVVAPITEGVSMSSSAVVSADRRYVKISTSPMFSTLTDVFTFSFINSGNPTGNPGVGGGN